MPKVVVRALGKSDTGSDIGAVLQTKLTKEGLQRLIGPAALKEVGAVTLKNLQSEKGKVKEGAISRIDQTLVQPQFFRGPSPRPRKGYFARVKAELDILICTNDKKYAQLRKTLTSKKSQTAIVAAIAAAVGAVLGLTAAAVMPFVAMVLMLFLEVGRNAYCSGE